MPPTEFTVAESAADEPEERTLAPRKRVLKGRGAVSNSESRYLDRRTEPVDDGWQTDWACEDTTTPARDRGQPTELLPDRTVRLITRNRSPDIPFDRSINPYKGCEHGCIYCFARPTHAYLDLSPGLDFETRIFYKTGVAERLVEELTAKGYQCQPIAMGTNTDPYQPAERKLRITRQILEMLLEWRHPVTLVTKSQLVLRDLDLLSELARLELVRVSVSVTTLDNTLKTRLEPRTASPAARLKVIRELAAAGVPVGAMLAPVIPFINDQELEALVAASVASGAGTLGYILLRLPLEVAPLFREWLDVHYPERASRVENAIRQMRGGKLYQAEWGTRMRGAGAMAELIEQRFQKALKDHRVASRDDAAALRTDLFSPPGHQGSLF